MRVCILPYLVTYQTIRVLKACEGRDHEPARDPGRGGEEEEEEFTLNRTARGAIPSRRRRRRRRRSLLRIGRSLFRVLHAGGAIPDEMGPRKRRRMIREGVY